MVSLLSFNKSCRCVVPGPLHSCPAHIENPATWNLHYLHKLGVLLQAVAGILYLKIFLNQTTFILRKTCKPKRNAYFFSVIFSYEDHCYKKRIFRENPAIRLEFPFDFELKELVRTFPGCQWDPKNKVWWVPYTDEQYNALLRFFKDKVGLDDSEFQAIKLSLSYPGLPPLTEVINCEVKAFEDWMRNKRYNESTIKTYRESIGLFIRFLGNKSLGTIDNEDFEKFNEEYIIEPHYSASF